jgi:hypothetical protein
MYARPKVGSQRKSFCRSDAPRHGYHRHLQLRGCSAARFSQSDGKNLLHPLLPLAVYRQDAVLIPVYRSPPRSRSIFVGKPSSDPRDNPAALAIAMSYMTAPNTTLFLLWRAARPCDLPYPASRKVIGVLKTSPSRQISTPSCTPQQHPPALAHRCVDPISTASFCDGRR